MDNKDARRYFHGICPYTATACGCWNCEKCGVEKEEREWMDRLDREEEV